MPTPFFRLLFFGAAAWLSTASAGFAQESRKSPSAAALKKNIALLRACTEGESDSLGLLLDRTIGQLVAYLSAHELSAAAAQDLGLDVTQGPPNAAHLKVYSVSYESRRTLGTVHQNVLQGRKSSGHLFAGAPDEEGFFAEIHPLAVPGRTFYLLLGGDKGLRQCLNNEAYVIEWNGQGLVLDHAAFGHAELMLLCNAEMTYVARTRQLRIAFADKETALYNEERLHEYGYRLPPGAKSLVLHFRGGRFVQTR